MTNHTENGGEPKGYYIFMYQKKNVDRGKLCKIRMNDIP